METRHPDTALETCSQDPDKLSNGLPLRRDLSEEAVLSSEEILAGIKDPDFRVIAVSVPWLSKTTPDALGQHLKVLGNLLKEYIQDAKNDNRILKAGVFIDFMSMYQPWHDSNHASAVSTRRR